MGNPREHKGFSWTAGYILQEYGLFVMGIILVAVFAVVNTGFLTPTNIEAIIEQNAALAIVAVGVTFTIIAGQFDMSPGSVVALSSVVMALAIRGGQSMGVALLVAMGGSLACGLFNGLLLSYGGINSVIVTLAAMIWARGLALGITKGDSIPFSSPFIDFMNSRNLLGISPIVVLVAVCYILGWYLLRHTRLGRYAFAIGGDVESTKQAGVNTNLYKLLIFLLSAVFVGIGTIVTATRMAAGAPNAVYGLEFDAIVAVIIGGSSMTGGEGSIVKTLVGVLFISILNNGLSTLGMRDSAFYLYKGAIILVALLFEVISRRLFTIGRTSAASARGRNGAIP